MQKFKDYFNKTKKYRYQFGQDFNFDWLIAFIFFVVLGIGLMIFTIFSYKNESASETINQAGDVPGQNLNLLDTKLLQRIISYFEQDKIEIEKLSSNPTEIVDPSI